MGSNPRFLKNDVRLELHRHQKKPDCFHPSLPLLKDSFHHLGPWHKSKHQRPGSGKVWKVNFSICSPKRWFSVFENGVRNYPVIKGWKQGTIIILLTKQGVMCSKGFLKTPLKNTPLLPMFSLHKKFFISKVTIQSDFRFRVVNDRSSCNELASLWICGPNLGPSWPWCRYDVWVKYDSYLYRYNWI